MKRFAGTVAIITLLLSGRITNAQLSAAQQKAILVKRMAQINHYSPRPVDDSFSVAVFKSTLESADSRRLFFTANEYQQLTNLSLSIDDELQGHGWSYLDKFSSIYKKALVRADSIVNKLLQKPFDFSATDVLGQSKRGEGFNFSADIAALNNRWSRYLKYAIMREVYRTSTADSNRKVAFKTALTSLEPAIREKIKKAELSGIKKILEAPAGYDAFMSELFLNAIASCFDPHSNYFSPKAKEEFQAELSTEAYFFGIVFDETETGQIVIDKLSPGGAAWKSGEINKGDELISLQWEGKELHDMTGAELDDVYDILDESLHDKLLFRLRKADGTISMVVLRKEKSDNEENIVKSFILKGEKKIGYILLPGFYTEWENESGSSCANDVAKEIVRLKKENIDALILDVRYNGGGSVGEALEMIGIFVDEGPLGAVKTKGDKQQTLKDPNRGTIYDGPLSLMINGQSASASELLASSLQDYHRALIVGSNSYGKATMQQMFPLDTITSKLSSGDGKSDMIKITTGKLYRVTGKTTQLKGVIPDIIMPDAFDGLEIGERFEKNVLPSDSAKANSYYKPLPYLPVADLAQRSATRVAGNADFQVIKKFVEEQQRWMQSTTRSIPLKAELFEKWMQDKEANLKAMKGEGKTTGPYKVENHTADKLLMTNNQYAKEINEGWLENLAEDIYIRETYLVLTDLINSKTTSTKN